MTSTLRRYPPKRKPLAPRDPIPPRVRQRVKARDRYRCVGPVVDMPFDCAGPLELDHVRASGGLGLKSESTESNLVTLCSWVHHRLKTDNTRHWRPVLLDYLARAETAHG